MSQRFSSPPRLILGDGALEQLAAELPSLGTKVLVVTDPGIVAAGILSRVLDVLKTSDVEIATFADVVGNPDIATVDAANQARVEAGADILIAIGGGSSMDVAKSVAVLATNGGGIADYEGVDSSISPRCRSSRSRPRSAAAARSPRAP